MTATEPLYQYDAFASYATNPDRDLVRAVEAFVESFYRRRDLSQEFRRELQICVDGRDFRIPRRTVDPRTVVEVIERHMQLSRALLVFCGPQSRHHPWIDLELRWWLANRPGAPIYFALTHGTSVDPADVQPPPLLEIGGADLPIFFDLRGFYQDTGWLSWLTIRSGNLRRRQIVREAQSWTNTRPFGEEAAKLVARLLADALGRDIAVSEVEPAWANDERRARRLKRWLGFGLSSVLLIFGLIAVSFQLRATASAHFSACASAEAAEKSYYESDERYHPDMPKDYIAEREASLRK